jgi:hypothetical protein
MLARIGTLALARGNVSMALTTTEFRTRIRELMAQVLPKDPPPIVRPPRPQRPEAARSTNRAPFAASQAPQVQYFHIAGQVGSVHAACDAMWKQERAPREPGRAADRALR